MASHLRAWNSTVPAVTCRTHLSLVLLLVSLMAHWSSCSLLLPSKLSPCQQSNNSLPVGA